jgi:hypothetical protein
MKQMPRAQPPTELPDDLPFEGWVNYVFDHPEVEPKWWWKELETANYQYWNESANPAKTLDYLTRLFSNPSFLPDRFSRRQIDAGLNFLVSNSCSDHMYVLTNTELPWERRRNGLESMITLYRDLMAPVYGNDLGHIGGTGEPTFSCYMWWDVIPLYGGMEHPDRELINDSVLRIFEQTLDLESEACQESVLHGLSHWHMYMPQRTEPLVRRFLKRQGISPQLRSYAEIAAKGGCL